MKPHTSEVAGEPFVSQRESPLAGGLNGTNVMARCIGAAATVVDRRRTGTIAFINTPSGYSAVVELCSMSRAEILQPRVVLLHDYTGRVHAMMMRRHHWFRVDWAP